MCVSRRLFTVKDKKKHELSVVYYVLVEMSNGKARLNSCRKIVGFNGEEGKKTFVSTAT